MLATPSGNGWDVTAVDNHPGPGHQFQPSIACTGIRSTVAWYDQRSDIAFLLNPLDLLQAAWNLVFFPFIIDPIVPPPAHTIDVFAAQTDKFGTFQPNTSIRVSNYPLVFDTLTNQSIQLQFNFLNAALFGGGQVPFLGDYNETLPKNVFTPPLCTDATCTALTPWKFNDFANESPIVHVLWTDNRDRASDPRECRNDRLHELRRAWDGGVRPGDAYQAGHAVVDSQPESLHRVPRRRVRDAGGGQRAADSGSREARLRRPDAEPRGAGRQSTDDVQEAVPADACCEQRSGVVQFRHRLHQPLVDPADDFHRPGLRLGRREDGVRAEGRDGSCDRARRGSPRVRHRQEPDSDRELRTDVGSVHARAGRGEEPGRSSRPIPRHRCRNSSRRVTMRPSRFCRCCSRAEAWATA